MLYRLKPCTFSAFRDKLERYLEFRNALPADESAVSQRDIDRAMGALRPSDERATSPKGISPQTFDEISRAVRGSRGGLGAAEVGKAVGGFRVTAWRYLEKLADDGLVERRNEYGRAGRPQVRYVWR